MPFDIVSKHAMSMLLPAKYAVRIFFYSSSFLKYVITSHPTLSLNISCKYTTKSLGCHVVCLWVEESFILSYIWNAHQHLEMNLWIWSATERCALFILLILPCWCVIYVVMQSLITCRSKDAGNDIWRKHSALWPSMSKPKVGFWPSMETGDSFSGSLNKHRNLYIFYFYRFKI